MVYLFCDGACKGNPGIASVGIFVTETEKASTPLLEYSQTIGIATNNIAEWTALKIGLEKVLELGKKEVTVKMDSELVVRQTLGEYKVKDKKLIPIYREVCLLKMQFQKFEIQYIPRELNSKADKLANIALKNIH